MPKPTIYFDMDGTLFDLYNVPNWLQLLHAENPDPYIRAKPMLNMHTLARRLNRLKRQGYKVGIISWLSMDSSQNYSELVRNRKLRSLNRHLRSVQWDEIHLVKYGTPKHYIAQDKFGIIFDDNEEVRNAWRGRAYTEKEILQILGELS